MRTIFVPSESSNAHQDKPVGRLRVRRHETDHGGNDERGVRAGELLEVLGQPAAETDITRHRVLAALTLLPAPVNEDQILPPQPSMSDSLMIRFSA
jgi:hypothetical protein